MRIRACARRWLLTLIAAIATLAVALPAVAGQAILAWDASTDPSVIGFYLYYGQASRTYTVKVDIGNQHVATLPNLNNGQTYYFAATAYNAARVESGYSNEVTSTISSLPTTPALQTVVSRKAHGAAGTFDLPLSLGVPPAVNHNPTTEPRQGPTQTIVFTFDKPVTGATAAIAEGAAVAGTPTFSGKDVIVLLAGVTNQQYVTVSLSNVSSSDGGTGGIGSARIGFLLGDVNGSRVVSLADVGLVNALLSQPVTGATYLKDVNASGTLTLADKGTINLNLTKALPTP